MTCGLAAGLIKIGLQESGTTATPVVQISRSEDLLLNSSSLSTASCALTRRPESLRLRQRKSAAWWRLTSKPQTRACHVPAVWGPSVCHC